MLDARGFDGKWWREDEGEMVKMSDEAVVGTMLSRVQIKIHLCPSYFLALAAKESIITSDGVLISTLLHSAAQPKPRNYRQRG